MVRGRGCWKAPRSNEGGDAATGPRLLFPPAVAFALLPLRTPGKPCVFNEFFGNLYHLNAEEELESMDHPKDSAFKVRFGPRGMKTTVAEQMAEEVTAVYPVGFLIGVAPLTEGEKIDMAVGDYNRLLDKKIAEIQQKCGVK